MNKTLQYLALATALAVVVGCGGQEAPSSPSTPAPIPAVEVPINADAGLPLQQSADDKLLLASITRASRRAGGPRSDPFALKPDEARYEMNQNTERVIGSMGDFSGAMFTPKSETAATPPPVVEPQPYRRLAGVVVGDSVLALIDMGNGTTELIRPGQKIPGTEWTVVSIDEEKAVLRRSGNVLPHQITVRLELPPPGFGGGTTPAGPGGFGPPGGPGGPGGAPGKGPGGTSDAAG